MNDFQHMKLWRRLAFERGGDENSVFQVVDRLTPGFCAGHGISYEDRVILRKAFEHYQLRSRLWAYEALSEMGVLSHSSDLFPISSSGNGANGKRLPSCWRPLPNPESSGSSATPTGTGQLGPVALSRAFCGVGCAPAHDFWWSRALLRSPGSAEALASPGPRPFVTIHVSFVSASMTYPTAHSPQETPHPSPHHRPLCAQKSLLL